MNRRTDILARLAERLPRLCGFVLLLILPFGYYTDYPDSSQFEIGVGGGFGQVASITRSCSGDVIEKEANSFQDFAVSGFARVKLSDRSELVYGTQVGYFRATARFAEYEQLASDEHVDCWYFGPRLALETKYFGAGLGMIYGRVPYNFEYTEDWFEAEVSPSAHLRIGSLHSIYLLSSFGENVPLAAGGGYFDVGVGYRIGGKARLYSALSWLPYDQPGFLQQVDLGLSRKMALQLAMRAGQAEGIFEGALSASLIFRLGTLGE